jgi:hypothetical protein
MENQKKDSKLTLVDRAFALPGSEEEFGMKIADHKLICNVLDDHLDSIMDNVDEKILKTLQSEELANTIAGKVRADVAETYVQLAAVLKNIEAGQVAIAEDITEIKKRLTINENNVELEKKEIEIINLRLDQKKKDITKLREDYESNKKNLEDIAKHKPTLETIQKIFVFWSWKKNWLKIIGAIIGVIAIIFVLFWLFLSIMQYRGIVTDKSSKTGVQQIKVDTNIKK